MGKLGGGTGQIPVERDANLIILFCVKTHCFFCSCSTAWHLQLHATQKLPYDCKGIQAASLLLNANQFAGISSDGVHVCAVQTPPYTRYKNLVDQRRGKQSPPLLGWLSALHKCLFVVKSRVKAPPCGRSSALAQVNTVSTQWWIHKASSSRVLHNSHQDTGTITRPREAPVTQKPLMPCTMLI